METKKKCRTFSLTDEIEEDLRSVAAETGHNVSSLVRFILREYLKSRKK